MKDARGAGGAVQAQRHGGTSPLLYLACVVLMAATLGLDLATPTGLAMGIPYVAAVVLALRSPKPRFIMVTAIACSAYTLVAVLYKASPGGWSAVLLDRTLALFAIWVTALLAVQRRTSDEQRERAIQAREEAVAQVKVLRGLLPICASCKQIRDDEGYWTQIEVYIRDHSQAQFSHGICPACARKLYPDFYGTTEPESEAGS